MRPLTLALVLLSIALAPALAAAHASHFPCSTSTSLTRVSVVHLDAYTGRCLGLVASVPDLACRGADLHSPGLHVLVLYGAGCQTGVIAQFLRVDDATPLLP